MSGVFDFADEESVLKGHFVFNGYVLDSGPEWGLSLKKCGSMRFRWNEKNENREKFVNELCAQDKELCQVELIHSKDVMAVESASVLERVKADGIITKNSSLVPVVTVADCVPIFLWNPVAKVFGTLHSGWKGTGIVKNALSLAFEKYNALAKDFCVVIGPHIHGCCYTVNNERAKYFVENFGSNCVKKLEENSYSLSLLDANLNLLQSLGVPQNNILVSEFCTCCDTKFGSFRRETGGDILKPFTVQIAWTRFIS